MDARVSRSRPRDVEVWARHLANFGPLAVFAASAFWLGSHRVSHDLPPFVRGTYGLLVALNVLVLAMSSWSGVLGAVLSLSGRSGMGASGLALGPPSGLSRIAVLFAIHEEDAAQVFAAARAIADDMEGDEGTVDVFVLSDSHSATAVAAEEEMLRLASHSSGARLLYCRRDSNVGRKAGNVSDFVRRWGAAYDFMVVLDADSLMTGACIGRLVGAMEANPRAGLVQAMCYPVGRRTIFARFQQFDSRLVGPLFQAGVAFWQGSRGNFWGHNAIIRCSAFAASCGLPELPGAPPFGGEILSHDTVEAALLLRRGWDVWMLPAGPNGQPDGSWEETPTNLVDHLARDRRWLRGNLQHVRVLAATGLCAASLYHLIRGLCHFLHAPLLVAWLLAYAAIDRGTRLDTLAWLVVALALAPRVLGLCAALAAPDTAGFGSRSELIASAIVSQVLAILLYPTIVASHLVHLGCMLFGGETRWFTGARGERELSWNETLLALAPSLAVAFVALLALTRVATLPVAWLLPGIFAAVPLAIVTSRRDGGLPLFAIPDDTEPHPLRLRQRELATRLGRHQQVGPGASPSPLPLPCGLPMPTQSLRDRLSASLPNDR